MRKVYFFLLAFLFATVLKAQVSVTATAGTAGPTPYATLSDAFNAINAGTHQGAITIGITASFTDAAVAVLNSDGAGTALYTSVLIRPTVDGVTMSFASATGRGVIELNGADNVTIDGDNPNTAGTNRNLTITNTAANTVTFTSVIRVALSTLVTSANGVIVRNCIVNGSATGRNATGLNSTTGTEATTYGILVGGGASTAAATTAPSAIASVATTMASGQTANNFIADNNTIDACSRGISVNGSVVGNINTFTLSNNVIGSATPGNATTVYLQGISVQGFTAGIIRGNTIRNIETFVGSSTNNVQLAGLALGSVSSVGTGLIVEQNNITHVINKSTSTFGSTGVFVSLSSTSNSTLRNNFISDISHDMTGGAAFSFSFNVTGIKIMAGTNYNVYQNSVNLFGTMPGTPASSHSSCCLGIGATTQTNVDVRNNVFSNTMIGGTTSVAHVAVILPTGGTAAMNYTQNNNAYYSATGANQFLAHTGTSFTTTYTAANFNAASNAPATNWRSYTSTLSAAGTNDNSSFAFTTAAPFVSTTDLHIPNATATPLESSGAALGVTNDIDGDIRNATTPDLGADEFTGVFLDIQAPAISYTPLGTTCIGGDRTVTGVTITDGSGVPTTGALRPRIYYRKNAGTYFSQPGTLSSGTGTNGVWSFTIVAADMGGLVTGDVVFYYLIAQDIAAVPNISSSPSGAVATDVNTVTSPPASTNGYTVGSTLTGTYTVGTGGNYTTLTAAAAAYNAGCLSGPVVFSLTDAAYAGETFPIVINGNINASATNTLTIRPAVGVAVTLSGSNVNALIKLNGADYVILDGLNTGGSSMIINNTNAAGLSMLWLSSASTTDGATNNIIRNCTFTGISSTGTVGGIIAGSGATLGNPADAANSNNTIQGCLFTKAQNGIYISGLLTTFDQNWVINQNTFGSTSVVADKMSFRGLSVQGVQNFTISNNIINGVVTASTSTTTGISVFGAATNGNIFNNKIADIKNTNTSGFGCNGILLTPTSTTSAISVYNNFISDVAAFGFNGSGSADNGYGIILVSGGGFTIYNNTVLMNTNQTAVGGLPAAINITSGITTAASVNIRNNIFANTQTIGTNRYTIFSGAANTVYAAIDYNDYYTTGPNLGFIGSNRADLAAIQAGFGGNTRSISFNPTFVSATDLHLVSTAGSNWCLDGAGVNIATVTTDIDAAARNNPPDIGADEFNAAGFIVTNPVTVCAPTTVDLTAAAVTTGSMGGLTFTYFTDAAATAVLANPNAVAASGTYYIKASNGSCALIRPVIVTVNPIVAASSVLVQPTTCVSADGSITLTLTGAAGPYTFAWTGPGVIAGNQNQTGLTIGAYSVTITPASGCPTVANFNLIGPGGCSVCPTIGTVTTTPATTACTNTNVTMTATGLTNMGISYGITFKYSATALANPYTGGTVFATVPNGSLTGGGTQATAISTFAAGGNYFVYAVLSPAPADPVCRPFVQTNLLVNAAPVLTCPANITVSNTAGQCNAIVNYPPATVTGLPAPAVTYSTPSGSVFPVGTTTVTVTAVNSCGTTTCTFTVRVNDTQLPVITCPANISVANTAGQCNSVVTFTPTATDNCSGVTITSLPASGSTFALGATTVVVTARDASNNTSTCSFTVTVTDNQLPVITSQPVASRSCATNTATFSVTATNAVSYQWQVSTGGAFTNISGATGATLTLTNVTIAMTGYVYRVIVNGACTQVTSNTAVLTVSGLPSISDITASPYTKLSPGQVTTLSTTYNGFPGNFTWFRNNTVARVTNVPTIGNITIDSIGVYRVMLTDVNGCTATSADINISAEPNFRLFVYPNPNKGIFQVRFYSYTLGVNRTLSVFDSKGNLVFKKQFRMDSPYEKMEVDVSRYTQGYYHVELRDASGKYLGSGSALYLY